MLRKLQNQLDILSIKKIFALQESVLLLGRKFRKWESKITRRKVPITERKCVPGANSESVEAAAGKRRINFGDATIRGFLKFLTI